MRKLFLLIILFGFSNHLEASINPDSLIKIWNEETFSDTVRLEAIFEAIEILKVNPGINDLEKLVNEMIVFAAERDNTLFEAHGWLMYGHLAKFGHLENESGQDYFKKSLTLYRQEGFTFGIARSTSGLGLTYQSTNPVKTIKLLEEAVQISLDGNDKRAAIGTYCNLSSVLLTYGRNMQAYNSVKQAVKIAEELQDTAYLALSWHALSHIYSAQDNFDQSNIYHLKTLELYKLMGDNSGIMTMTIHLADYYREEEKYDDAKRLYFESIELGEKFGNNITIAMATGQLADLYYKQDSLDLALDYLNKSEKFRKYIPSGNAEYLTITRGLIYLKKKQYKKAVANCEKARKYYRSINNAYQENKTCLCLYEAYKALKLGNKAIQYHERHLALEEIAHNDEVAAQLKKMEYDKQFLVDSLKQAEEKKVIELAHQEEIRKKQNNTNLAAGVGLLFLLLSGGLFSRWKYIKKSKAKLQIEKDRSENLLLNILPAEIAEELKQSGKSKARDYNMVSILFTDFKEFTQTSELLSAQELVSEINVCFQAFDKIIEKYKVEKIKTIGDSYMAAGGLPVPHSDSVKNTVLAAIDMQAFISSRKIEKDKEGLPAFEMRVGINTGPVVAGIVGVKKFQYDIWGDTVNTASRIESNGEVAKVNISQRTYEILKSDPDFVFESRGKIQAKGKGEVEMYFVNLA